MQGFFAYCILSEEYGKIKDKFKTADVYSEQYL